MDRIPKSGECYRHFKNKLYQIITVAEHSETGERMVVYQALYGTFGMYVRPLSMFISEVDHDKYPDVKQKYRFERVELKKTEEEAETEEAEKCGHGTLQERTDMAAARKEAPISTKNLLAFLDAGTYDEKLEVLKERCDIFTEEELAAVCESLDIGSGAGTKKAMYRAALNYLEMQSKYDGARLR